METNLCSEREALYGTFFNLLNKAQVVTVDDGPLLNHWLTDEPNDHDDNQIVHFSWTDGESNYSCDLSQDGVASGKFGETGEFLCVDCEGDPVCIRFFSISPLNQTIP